jgi:hypothetical protein
MNSCDFFDASFCTVADYDGSSVKQLSLRELELLHRLSFGHRNQRSYLVVLYKPDSAACQAFEAEVGVAVSGLIQHLLLLGSCMQGRCWLPARIAWDAPDAPSVDCT